MLRLLAALAILAGPVAGAAEEIPPTPAQYFNDYAGLVPPDAAQRLEEKLRRFDDEGSNQILVAIFPELPSPSLEDFTIRAAQAWRAGRKELDNGVVLFVFVKERKVRLEVGYGLEGALPDVTAKRIIEDAITPRFRTGDFAGGVEAGVDAVVAATRGEYSPPPRRGRGRGQGTGLSPWFILAMIVVFLIMNRVSGASRSRTYRRAGWYGGGFYGGGWGGGGGGWGGGGGGGGGGGFSGGGGSFGGGGASGDW